MSIGSPGPFSRLHLLEQLFGSATRLHLLRLFLHNEGKYYFVRELTRTIGVQLHAVRRELAHLTALGLIVEKVDSPGEASGKRKYYQLNVEHILVTELRNLILKTDVLLEHDLADALGRVGPVQYVALMGKLVNEPELSTDLFVVGKLNRVSVKNLIHKFEKRYGQEIRYTVLTQKEFFYRKGITDKFLYEILDAKKMVLVNTLGIP